MFLAHCLRCNNKCNKQIIFLKLMKLKNFQNWRKG